MNDHAIELLPDNPGTPVFKTPEEQRAAMNDFGEQIRARLAELPKPVRLWPYPRFF